MKRLTAFGSFLLVTTLGFYAGNINSSLLGIDLTSASTEIVNLFKIGLWVIALGILSRAEVA
jgi:hypothetical protein